MVKIVITNQKNFCTFPMLGHQTQFLTKKCEKTLICSFAYFSTVQQKMLEIQHKLLPKPPKMVLISQKSLDIWFLSKNYWKKMFCKQILKSVKEAAKNPKTMLFTLSQFWQQEKGQMISADVLYQMVGLFDDNNLLFSYVRYIWVSFQAS